ncbi:MAG: TIGR02186 family protein [Rickettsiales bacterium]
MNWRTTMIAVLCSVWAMSAHAQKTEQHAVSLTNPLVADLSQNAVAIRTSFNGAQLLVFGAQNIPGELVIAVRGPEANLSLRRKERIAGMWMHVDQRSYGKLPLFYALASTKPLDEIAAPALLQTLGLGESQVILSGNARPNDRFDTALFATLSTKQWWQVPFAKITYFGESLFKARLNLPDTLPRGDFTAEVYLFDSGQLVAFQSIPLAVYNTGFDAWITDKARNRGLAYGIFSVLLALLGGWLAHRVFSRG